MTTDEQRDIVLRQNDALPRAERPSLRRCCICLRSIGDCAKPDDCRAQFAQWAERKWTDALAKEHVRRHPSEPVVYFGDGPFIAP